jgi:hypothetical protein
LPTHLDDGADHPKSALIEIERVGAQAGCLSPPESGTARGGNDGAVPVGHSREQVGHQLLSGNDPFIRVVLAPWWQPDVLAGIEGKQAVGHCRPEDGAGKLVTLGDDVGGSPLAKFRHPSLHR